MTKNPSNSATEEIDPQLRRYLALHGAEIAHESQWEGLLEAGLITFQQFHNMAAPALAEPTSRAELRNTYQTRKAQSLLQDQIARTVLINIGASHG
jgi:hypothetical protein